MTFLQESYPQFDFTMQLVQKQERTHICYYFFKKSMSSKFTIIESSALSQNKKLNTIMQEFIRSLSSTSGDNSQAVEEYICSLYRSGYKASQIRKDLTAAIVGYEPRK